MVVLSTNFFFLTLDVPLFQICFQPMVRRNRVCRNRRWEVGCVDKIGSIVRILILEIRRYYK